MTLLAKLKKAFQSTPAERLPNFFIAGAARGGTTSMWQYLRQHPDIHMPPVFEWKEPSYYCELYGMRDRNAYLALFANAGSRKMVGEASGPYLTSPDSPGRIRAEIPDARFIIMLRNPAERAFSKFKWMCENGYEKCETFEEALRAEVETRKDNVWFMKNNGQYYHNFLYFNSGLYAGQVKRFYDTFGQDRVLVIIFEDFARDTLHWVRQAYAFLGVDASFTPHLEVHNPTSQKTRFDLVLRAELMEKYAPSIVELEALLQRELRPIWV